MAEDFQFVADGRDFICSACDQLYYGWQYPDYCHLNNKTTRHVLGVRMLDCEWYFVYVKFKVIDKRVVIHIRTNKISCREHQLDYIIWWIGIDLWIKEHLFCVENHCSQISLSLLVNLIMVVFILRMCYERNMNYIN